MSVASSDITQTRFRIDGEVARVTFYNEENGYTVFVVRSGLYETPVTGITNKVFPGEQVSCVGVWENHPTHGRQLKADTIQLSIPVELNAIRRYLGSGIVKSIGEHFAGVLVDRFGKKIFEVLDKEPEKLMQIPGIGQKRVNNIRDQWEEQRKSREAMVFLLAHGFGNLRAAKIYKTYGRDTIRNLKEDPYRVYNIHGIGFEIADEFARKLGFDAQDPKRLAAGIQYTLTLAEKSGNCGMSRKDLLAKAGKILGVPAGILESELEAMIPRAFLVQESWSGQEILYRPELWRAEVSLAQQLNRLLQGQIPWSIPATLLEPSGIQLSPFQRQARDRLLRTKVGVLTGGPGVGKTTLIRSLLLNLHQDRNLRVALCAPTGRAAKRIEESTGEKASTIHRLLEYGPLGFKYGVRQPLEYDLVIVDESSMVDLPLMQALADAIDPAAGLWLVGDANQLPSVGPGAILHDIIASQRVPVVALTEIYRQAESSAIVRNAHRILSGVLPQKHTPGEPTDFYLFSEEDPENLPDRVIDLVTQKIPNRFGFSPRTDIQVLAPMRKGSIGAEMLSQRLQAIYHPNHDSALLFGRHKFYVGDRVMQTVNDYEKLVFNGEVGTVVDVNLTAKSLVVEFDDGRKIDYDRLDLDNLMLAYALSIHKSQGSEYPVVVIPLSTQHYALLERNLLYTGVTRGRKMVVLIGQERAIALAVRTEKGSQRLTTLTERLQTLA